MGARLSRERNADQTAAAIFWSGDPVAIWRAATLAAFLASARDGESRGNALDAVSFAMATALAAAAPLRHRCGDVRPAAIIRGEIRSRLWIRSADPEWEPLIQGSAGGEAPCQACIAGGAAGAVLRALLQSDEIGISLADYGGIGLTRRFDTVSQMLQEAEDARVWAGLQFRSIVVEATETGLQLGEMAVSAIIPRWPPPPPPASTASSC